MPALVTISFTHNLEKEKIMMHVGWLLSLDKNVFIQTLSAGQLTIRQPEKRLKFFKNIYLFLLLLPTSLFHILRLADSDSSKIVL